MHVGLFAYTLHRYEPKELAGCAPTGTGLQLDAEEEQRRGQLSAGLQDVVEVEEGGDDPWKQQQQVRCVFGVQSDVCSWTCVSFCLSAFSDERVTCAWQ